jgi:hypothetical protein
MANLRNAIQDEKLGVPAVTHSSFASHTRQNAERAVGPSAWADRRRGALTDAPGVDYVQGRRALSTGVAVRVAGVCGVARGLPGVFGL